MKNQLKKYIIVNNLLYGRDFEIEHYSYNMQNCNVVVRYTDYDDDKNDIVSIYIWDYLEFLSNELQKIK